NGSRVFFVLLCAAVVNCIFANAPNGVCENELPQANLTTMFIGAKWHKGLVWARAALLLCALVLGKASQGADADPAKAPSVTQVVPPETEVKPLHWSLKPIVRPPPGIGRKRQSANPLDGFILDQLSQNKLAPSPPADRRTLIRRLYFDL